MCVQCFVSADVCAASKFGVPLAMRPPVAAAVEVGLIEPVRLAHMRMIVEWACS